MILRNNISKPEKYFYFSVWISAVLYSLYCFSRDSYSYFKNYKDNYDDFTDGFYHISSKRDKSDFEWEAIYYLLTYFFPWVFVYVFISEFIRNLPLNIQVFKVWQISFTVLYLLYEVGYLVLCLVLIQPIIFYVLCNFYRNTVITWFCTGISLCFITYCKQISSDKDLIEFLNLNPYQIYFIILCLFWMNLKCTSYFLEEQSSKEFLNYLAFCLYPSTILTGPFISLKDYLKIFKPTPVPLHKRVGKFIFNIARCLFWFVFTNFCLHYVYVNATSYQTKMVEKLDNWSLYGYGYAMGQFFHIKYVVLYGLSTSFASFENIEVPRLPRCIGRVHLYSDMWKYFDSGLYQFLLRYIYVPLCRICRYKLIASFACFLFVYLWHGLENYILIWTVLNYIGIVLEYTSSLLYKQSLKNFMDDINSCWARRIKCMLASPLLVVSAVSNFYFFAGTEIGNIFAARIFEDSFFKNIILVFILYCCCQASTELRISALLISIVTHNTNNINEYFLFESIFQLPRWSLLVCCLCIGPAVVSGYGGVYIISSYLFETFLKLF